MRTFHQMYNKLVERNQYESTFKYTIEYYDRIRSNDKAFCFEKKEDGKAHFINGMFVSKAKYEEFLDDFIETTRNAKKISDYEVLVYGESHFHTRSQIQNMSNRKTKYFAGGFELPFEEYQRIKTHLNSITDIAHFGKQWGFDYYRELEPGMLVHAG